MTMSRQAIERALLELRLSGIAATLDTRILKAQTTEQPFLETFCLLLQDELDLKRSRSTERRSKQSGLDERLTLTDFDLRFNPKVPRQQSGIVEGFHEVFLKAGVEGHQLMDDVCHLRELKVVFESRVALACMLVFHAIATVLQGVGTLVLDFPAHSTHPTGLLIHRCNYYALNCCREAIVFALS